MLKIVVKEGKVIKVYEENEPDTQGVAILKEGFDYELEIISDGCEHEPQEKTVDGDQGRFQVAGDICIKCQQLL